MPDEAEFLNSLLICSKDEKWQALKITGWAKTKKEVFFYDGKKWRYGAMGAVVFGQVIGKKLELENIDLSSF